MDRAAHQSLHPDGGAGRTRRRAGRLGVDAGRRRRAHDAPGLREQLAKLGIAFEVDAPAAVDPARRERRCLASPRSPHPFMQAGAARRSDARS